MSEEKEKEKTIVVPAPVKTTELIKPAALNWNEAENKLKQIEKFVKEFAGKAKHNPFMYLKHNIVPIQKELEARKSKGTLDAQFHARIMALPIEAPTVDKIPKQILDTLLSEPVDTYQGTKE